MMVTKGEHDINMFYFSFLVERKPLRQWVRSSTPRFIRLRIIIIMIVYRPLHTDL